MALTDDESKRLDEIAATLRAAHPHLEPLLTGRRRPRRRARIASMLSALGTCVTLGAGIALQIPALCVVAWFAMLVSALLVAIAIG